MPKNLVIVESPAKAKTIEKFLGKDYKVMSSFGHICDLTDKVFNQIETLDIYEPSYNISEDKVKVVSDLRENVRKCDNIWLASDEDREGEAIAWHLFNELNLAQKPTKRIVFHEITELAIKTAIENPRDIDKDIVDAQQARQLLDKIVGFEISPVLWRKVKHAKSAGRVQSVALRLVVEKEREINAFQQNSLFRVQATFKSTNGEKFTANLDHAFETEQEAIAFLELCQRANYQIVDIQKAPSFRNPSAPFTTSTLQQEASRKLGYSVKNTMALAQRLYESGKITYMRTDSVNLSSLAIASAKKEITESFGAKYHKSRNYTTKSKSAQEAHEAIRPTYLSNSEIDGTAQEKRLYSLIWKRTIASQMAPAQIERTITKIAISTTNDYHFIAEGEVTLFDGFMRVYTESTDNETASTSSLPQMNLNETLNFVKMTAKERFSQKPPRYTEASLVKKLEELGIGRPSTYASIISTIQERDYVEKRVVKIPEKQYRLLELGKEITATTATEKASEDKGKLLPTDIGFLVNDYLTEHFPRIMDYQFTANIESDFDMIESGKMEWHGMVKEFYLDFHPTVQTAIKDEKRVGSRLLGNDPKSGLQVWVKISRFGKPILQLGVPEELGKDAKPTFAPLPDDEHFDEITLENALKLLKESQKQNDILGEFEGQPVTVGAGRFGPFVKYGQKFVSIPKAIDPKTVDYQKAVEIILAKIESDKNKVIAKFEEEGIEVLNGRFGPYLTFNGANYKLPKNIDPKTLTAQACQELINSGEAKQAGKGTSKAKAAAETKKATKKSTKSKK